MRDFWRAIKFGSVKKGLTFAASFVSFAYIVLNLLIPLVMKNIFDLIGLALKTQFTAGDIPNKFWLLIALFGFLIILQSAIGQATNYFIARWVSETKKILSLKVFRHLEDLQLNYFEKNSTGKIRERVDKGISDLTNIMEGTLTDIAPQIFYILVATVVLFFVSWQFGAILVIGIPIYIFISLKFTPRLLAFQDKVRDANEVASAVATETIINIKTVKSYSAEKKHYHKLSDYLTASLTNTMSYIKTRISMNFFRFMIINFAQILILGLGVYWTLTGKFTLGTFTLAWSYTNNSFNPLWYLMRIIDNIQRDMRSVKRVFELLDTEPEINDIANAKNLYIKEGRVEFQNVKFSYDSKDVIKNLSLKIKPKSVVAIVGKSGVGKSTLIKLLLRFYQPQTGAILIDGQNILEVKQDSLRRSVGVVMQDSSLFNDTALNNIGYGKSRATKKQIIEAAKVANAHDFIKRLPEGYDTVVGERGVKLSGGEQQRINIARAVLKNPPVLILDEATSSLDSESEQLIQDALWKLIAGKTTIIIAHRLSTVMRADLIVVMDKGKIVETGTHKDLVEQKGIYARLFEIQSGGYLK